MRGQGEGRLFASCLNRYLFGLNIDEGGLPDFLAEAAGVGVLCPGVFEDRPVPTSRLRREEGGYEPIDRGFRNGQGAEGGEEIVLKDRPVERGIRERHPFWRLSTGRGRRGRGLRIHTVVHPMRLKSSRGPPILFSIRCQSPSRLIRPVGVFAWVFPPS